MTGIRRVADVQLNRGRGTSLNGTYDVFPRRHVTWTLLQNAIGQLIFS